MLCRGPPALCPPQIKTYLNGSACGGLSQIKTYLNGVHIKGLLTIRTLAAKLLGIVFAIGAGVVAGKEGPFVHGGGVVGGGIGGLGSKYAPGRIPSAATCRDFSCSNVSAEAALRRRRNRCPHRVQLQQRCRMSRGVGTPGLGGSKEASCSVPAGAGR